jgi:hypothetical protein
VHAVTWSRRIGRISASSRCDAGTANLRANHGREENKKEDQKERKKEKRAALFCEQQPPPPPPEHRFVVITPYLVDGMNARGRPLEV